MAEIRYTVIDGRGTVSFVGPAHILKMLVAGCARGPADLAGLLQELAPLDAHFAAYVRDGLALFDEHHGEGAAGGDAEAAGGRDSESAGGGEPGGMPGVFRVVDAASRQVSLQPASAGVVLFNLVERRIVQVQNSYGEIERQGRGRLRRAGRPVPTYYTYDLPEEWRLVP